MKDKTDSGVAPLYKNAKFHFQTKDKCLILRETFFSCKHLERIDSNEDHKIIVEKRIPEFLKDRTVDICETWYNSNFTLEEVEQTLRNLRSP